MNNHLNRTEEEKIELATLIIDYLNDLRSRDPKAIHQLIESRQECSMYSTTSLRDHPTVQISKAPGQPEMIGLLGVINGLVGVRHDGWGYIAAHYDDAGNLTGFDLTSKVRDT